MTASAIYSGTIRHRRFAEHEREFEHRVSMAYVDLDELPTLFGGRLVSSRPGPVRFRRSDYFGEGDLATAVRIETGVEARGGVRLLTNLNTFGHCFNPVSFYYCLERAGEKVEAVVAEVTNTPWGERHAYAIAGDRGELTKALHVSPFMGMDHRYVLRAGAPGARLGVHIESHRQGVRRFDATLALRRVELTRSSAARVARRYPLANVRVLALIYGHALGLKLAGASVYPHPGPHHVTQREPR